MEGKIDYELAKLEDKFKEEVEEGGEECYDFNRTEEDVTEEFKK